MGKRLIDKRYEVLKRLGSGGIGEVYEVKDRTSGASLALKLIRKGISEDAKLLFKKEFQTLASLSHSNIVKVHDFATLPDGRSHFTMDFVPGLPITRAFKGFDRKLYPALIEILSALDYIHSKGMIHGDLKPQNVLVTTSGRNRPYAISHKPLAVVLDFGFVEEIGLLGPAAIRGTLGYVAPELLKGGKVDQRADLYSLGIVLYETLTQRRAFRGKTATDTLRANLEKTLPSPTELDTGIPRKLANMVLKLVQKDPRDRYESARQVLEELASLTGSAVPRRARARAPELFYSPLVGREEELSLLDGLLSRAMGKEGQLVLISGEMGIGKSSLLRQFKLRAQLSGARVVSIFSSDGDLVGGFYKQLGLVTPKLETGQPGLRKLATLNDLANKLLKYVKAVKGPVVFLLDDLDRADETSQEALGFLSRSLRSQPVLMIGSCQQDGLSGKLIEGVKDEPFLTEIRLSGLSREETQALVLNLLNAKEKLEPIQDWVHSRTNGNPLLVEESLRSLLAGRVLTRRGETWTFKREALSKLRPSRTARALAAVWTGRLSSEERDLLSTAAVLGESFPLPLLGELSRLRESHLLKLISSLERNGLLHPEPGSYRRFSRRCVQDYLYKKLGRTKRKKLHEQAAKALEREPPWTREGVVTLLARHYREAGIRAKAFRFSVKAAESAESTYAPDTALDHYRAALKLAPLERRIELLRKVGEINQTLGFYKEALRNYHSALNLKALTADQKAELWLKIATIQRKTKEHPEALNAIQKGLSLMRQKETPMKADFLTEWAWISMERGDYAAAVKYCQKAEKLSAKAQDARSLAGVYNTLGILYWRKGDLKNALEFSSKTLDLRAQLGDRIGKARSYNNLGVIYWTKGEFKEADACYRNALREFERLGDIRSIADIHINLGLLAWTQGNWDTSRRHCESGYSLYDRLGDGAALASIHSRLGVIDEQSGNWDKALQHYEAHLRFNQRTGDTRGKATSLINLGSLFLKLGDLDKCRESLEQSLKLNQQLKDEGGIAVSHLNLAMLYRDQASWDSALQHIGQAVRIYEGRSLKKDLATAYRVLAEILLAKGKLGEARKSAWKGLNLAQKLGDKLELGHIHRTFGVLRGKRGEREKALSDFDTSLRLFRELSAQYELARTSMSSAAWRLMSKLDLHTASSQLHEAQKIFTRLRARADLERVRELGSLLVKTLAENPVVIAREAQLKALYEVSGVMASVLDIRTLYDKVLDLAISLLKAERGLLLMLGDRGEFVIAAGREMDKLTIEDATTLSKGVISQVAQEGLPVLSDDASADPRFRQRDSVILNNIHSLLCVPLKSKNTVLGTLYADSRISSRLFSSDDLSFLNALGSLLAVAIENARLHEELRQETDYLRREVEERYRLGNLVGRSKAMQDIFNQIETVATSDASVLIQGETGTGKELVARAIHYNGARKDNRFVPVECGALPEALAESELFGHRKGAYTDAKEDKPGLFEEADSGTMFLDQIDNLNPRLQAKLLRALQDGEVRRLGETRPRRVDVRVICATNKDLKEEIKQGRFRDDLYFRLNTFHLHLPPLRERREDIPLLVSHFLNQFLAKTAKEVKGLSREALKCLMAYSWPGNVRQLEHEVERAVTLVEPGTTISPDLLSGEVAATSDLSRLVLPKGVAPLKAVIALIERELIRHALTEHDWNHTRAARALGISRPSLIEKMERYNIERHP